MKKISFIITSFIASLLLVGVVYGSDTSGTTHVLPVVSSSLSTTAQLQVVEVAEIRSTSFPNQLNSTGLNVALRLDGVTPDIPMMPGSFKIVVENCFDYLNVDNNTNCQNTTVQDMNLPKDGVNTTWEFGLDHPANTLHLLIFQGGVLSVDDDWLVTWQYRNGASWANLQNVIDGTDGFRNSGQNKVTWDVPADWTDELLHTNRTSFWVRALGTLSSGSNTTAPLGSMAQYETGRYFYYVPVIQQHDLIGHALYMGGTDFVTQHSYFPGYEGLITADDADIEFLKNWGWNFRAGLKFGGTDTGKLLYKNGTMEVTYTANVTPAVNRLEMKTPSSYLYGEWTHNEEDGLSYYSNTAQESHSKTFYNAASNFLTSHQEDSSDLLTNTEIEVATNKIGLRYDKAIHTTPAIGAKINDPS